MTKTDNPSLHPSQQSHDKNVDEARRLMAQLVVMELREAVRGESPCSPQQLKSYMDWLAKERAAMNSEYDNLNEQDQEAMQHLKSLKSERDAGIRVDPDALEEADPAVPDEDDLD